MNTENWSLETTLVRRAAWIAIPRGEKHTDAQRKCLENRLGFTLAELIANYNRLVLSQD